MYETHFNLSQKPFSITSDPEFLFFSKKHQEAYDSLVYGIENRVGFVAVTGDIGSGKTTLCRALLNNLPSSVKTAYIFNSNISEIQFMQTFLSDLGLNISGKNRHELFSDLNFYLIEQLSNDNNVVLIIDEAQNLTVKLLEQIRMLSNLETDKSKLLQIILVGQPELKDKLLLPQLQQLRQRIGIRYHLLPLEPCDILSYIKHRLSVAGASEPDAFFTDTAVDEIYSYTKGVPRLINLVCDKALLACYAKGAHQVSNNIVESCINELEGVFP